MRSLLCVDPGEENGIVSTLDGYSFSPLFA